MNIFDEPDEEEIPEEPPPPPPPTFSEDELEAAKAAAFEKGRQQGIQENLQSREEKLANLMERISADVQTLFAAEKAREDVYEAEAVKLTLDIFKHLFPVYHKAHGFEELKTVLQDVLGRQEGQTDILIETSLEQKEGVESYISRVSSLSGKAAFKVSALESLQDGSCRLSWTNGGALYNSQGLADEIRSILEETLANGPTNSHDKDVEDYQLNTPDNESQDE